jgi:transposase InsO family protein
VAARKCGIHRTTLWRWKQKWQTLNVNVSQEKLNRPTRSTSFVPAYSRWNIATDSARPHTSPSAVSPAIVARVLALREQLNRCAEVIWYHLTRIGDAQGVVSVSLSSVRRILRRHHCFDGARKKRVRPDNPRRPRPTIPGELVQTDTIHHVDPYSGKRLYYYTVIDLFTRITHTAVSPTLRQGLAAQAVLDAQRLFGFSFAMVQADNGPEYGRFFEQTLHRAGIQTRHSRLHRPNDNAHIERFNRTLQTECIGYYWRRSIPLQRQQAALTTYLDYYNQERVHLGIQMRTPAEMLQRC